MAYLFQFVSLAVFTFGAPAFSVLAFSYLRQGYTGSRVFRVFTVTCAAAFLGNLTSAAIAFDSPTLSFFRLFCSSLLPPMMAHLILEQQGGRLARWSWGLWPRRLMLCFLYLFALFSAWIGESSWSDRFDRASQTSLAASSAFALVVLLIARGHAPYAVDRQRRWNFAIFTCLFLTSVVAIISDSPVFALIPDYLLLLFFAVRLYYTERLAFFDTFVKGGTYFAFGSLLVAFVLIFVPPFRQTFAGDWIHAWIGIIVLMPVWLLGPLLYLGIGRGIDHALHRRYSAIQAERFFMQAAQASNRDNDLHDAAVRSFQEIFRCDVQIDFDNDISPSTAGDLTSKLAPSGFVRLIARGNQVPFLSDDRRLLETLSATLCVLLQNVRLRSQQQDQLRREQELATLTSRAELRALRAQINPHFLFNALNAIAGWIPSRPEFADETVAQLAEVFRYTLQRSQNEWVSLREEFDFVRAYLAVEHARFGNRLETRVEASPEVNAISIPAMVIQPLIENALKHGVSQTGLVGKVALVAHLEGSDLLIEVSDNGCGFPPDFSVDGPAAGHGLRNVADRLKGYYGDHGTLRWENTFMGTRVTIKIPTEVLS